MVRDPASPTCGQSYRKAPRLADARVHQRHLLCDAVGLALAPAKRFATLAHGLSGFANSATIVASRTSIMRWSCSIANSTEPGDRLAEGLNTLKKRLRRGLQHSAFDGFQLARLTGHLLINRLACCLESASPGSSLGTNGGLTS